MLTVLRNRYKIECNAEGICLCAYCMFIKMCAWVSMWAGNRVCAHVPVSTFVSSLSAPKQPVSASTHNTEGNELASQQERVPTQQTMLRPGTVGNGISGGLQMCQLECERNVRYANEEENLLAWHAWPIHSTAACHSDTRLVRDGLWWLQQFML